MVHTKIRNHKEGPLYLNVKALVGAINQEKALVGAFSMILKSSQTFG